MHSRVCTLVASLPSCLALAAVLAGCGLGDGKGAVAGTLFVRSCTADHDLGSAGAPTAYDLRPSFFAADPIDDLVLPHQHPVNRLSVRVQPSGARIEEADVLFVSVANDRDLAMQLGAPVTVGPVSNVRAALALNQTCPKAEVQAELNGTITFTSFGGATAGMGASAPDDFRISFGDRIAASFSFDVVDRRAGSLGGIGGVPTAPAVAGHLDGSFDFVVRQGKAAQEF